MFIQKRKGRLGNMVRVRRIRSPAKILVGLRFKNRCVLCGKVITSDRMVCVKCDRKRKVI